MIRILYPSSYCTVISPGAMEEHFSENGYISRRPALRLDPGLESLVANMW